MSDTSPAAAAAPAVVILLGSPRDAPVMRPAVRVLHDTGVPHEVHALSAHRTQHGLMALVDRVVSSGRATVFVCAAGLAAHLAGLVAGRCVLPVIGVPLSRGPLSGLDALLATVQMPAGVPVATVGVDAAENAALLALQMLALYDPRIRSALCARRDADRVQYESFDAEIVVG